MRSYNSVTWGNCGSFRSIREHYPLIEIFYPPFSVRSIQFGVTIYASCIRTLIHDKNEGKVLLESVLRRATNGGIYNTCLRLNLDPNKIADEIEFIAEFIEHYDDYNTNDVLYYMVK